MLGLRALVGGVTIVLVGEVRNHAWNLHLPSPLRSNGKMLRHVDLVLALLAPVVPVLEKQMAHNDLLPRFLYIEAVAVVAGPRCPSSLGHARAIVA